MSTTEPTPTPVELAQLVVSGSRAMVRRIHLIEDPEGAAELLPILDGLITAAQELHGVAAETVGHREDDGETRALASLLGEVAPEAGGGKR